MRRTAPAALLAASLLLAGCSSSDDNPETKPSSNPTTASESTAATGNEALYDKIWNERSPEAQETLCDLLAADGPGAVSVLLEQSIDEPSVDFDALAEYINDEKC
jgi:hypothetical protein